MEEEFYTCFYKGRKARIYQVLNTQQVNPWHIKVHHFLKQNNIFLSIQQYIAK